MWKLWAILNTPLVLAWNQIYAYDKHKCALNEKLSIDGLSTCVLQTL
jgi:hypothetical protein